MKHRLCRIGKMWLSAACLLSAFGLSYSCSDDYDLDDTMPDFLGESIYKELGSQGTFKYTIRLIDDLNYADVLGQTGSKTLFVAPDSAYETFFKDNAWGVRSYEELTLPQKKYLLYNSMFNNAYVMEMMSNTESSGNPGAVNYVGGKNQCLRQGSASGSTDSIPYFHWYELPNNQNMATDDDEGDAKYGKFWEKYRRQDLKEGIFLVCDNTTPMTTHFLENNLKFKNITNDDVAFILGVPKYGTENRSYIYNARVVKQDVTCMNGYYNVLDRVLLAPSNMAEMIRTNGKTNLFSRILDRFSAPVYDSKLTNNAQALYASVTDSVFVKRYFSTRSQDGKFNSNPVTKNAMADFPVLNFDPGWNSYAASNTAPATEDMGAMFVPSDEALKAYFLTGGGRVLMDRYAVERPVTEANLELNIDQIPLDIISALVNNLMKASFCETVPSKYLTIMNDARDQMFNGGDYPTLDSYKAAIDKCLLANNGVVYIMNRVISPADYASVIAPALYSKNTRVVRAVVRADENFIQGSDYGNAPLQKYFSTYLKAMQSSFSFFVPVDEGLGTYGYVDPASIATQNPRNYRYWVWKYVTGSSGTNGAKTISVQADAYTYDPNTGQPDQLDENNWKGSSFRSAYSQPVTQGYGETKRALLIEMVNQHIIVHDNDDASGVLNTGRKYFLSRDGAPVIVKSGNTGNGENMEVAGGWQLQLENDGVDGNEHQCKVIEAYDQSKATNGYGNGHTFLINRPMQPSMQSVYGILDSNENFSAFKNLCNGFDAQVLQDAGFREKAAADAVASGSITDPSSYTEADWLGAAELYKIFGEGEVKAGGKTIAKYLGSDKLVRSFNNYNYTVYVPTNEAVEKALSLGLPTWDAIKDFVENHMEQQVDSLGQPMTDDAGNPVMALSADNKLKAQAMITMLTNFIRYHFQDNSLFVDNVTENNTKQTACIDEVNNVYLPIVINQTPNAMTLKDNAGNTRKVVTAGGKYNMLARDAHFNAHPRTSAASCKLIETSSYAVVHQIDDVLNFTKLSGGRYDSAWSTSAKAKKFVKKFQIKK